MRRPFSTAIALLTAAAFATACSSLPGVKKYLPGGGKKLPPDASARAASDVPEAFQSPAGPAPDGTCRDPLHDPRDGAAIHLFRSADGRGDYEIAAERYGVGKDELLRIDCTNGRPIGIVAR